MNARPLLALLAACLAAAPLLAPAGSAAGCLIRSVNGPFGLQVAYVEAPLPPGPVCPATVVVYVCAAHVDVDPNALTASVSFDACVGHVVLPLA